MGQRLLWASRSRGLLLSSASFVWLAAAAPSTVSAAYTFDTSEAAFDADYLKKPIAIDATIVDAAGQPLADATITVVGFGVGSSNKGRTTATSAAGSFTITGLTRRSALLKITRAGWYTEIVPVDLQRPADQAAVSLGRVRRNKSGTFKLTTRILDDGSTLSTIDRVTLSGGTDLDWRPFSVDLVAPSSATDLRLYFKQSPPGSGEGQVFLDDVSVILWEGKVSDAKAGAALPTPNNYGFVRFTGATGSSLDVSLTHRVYSEPVPG